MDGRKGAACGWNTLSGLACQCVVSSCVSVRIKTRFIKTCTTDHTPKTYTLHTRPVVRVPLPPATCFGSAVLLNLRCSLQSWERAGLASARASFSPHGRDVARGDTRRRGGGALDGMRRAGVCAHAGRRGACAAGIERRLRGAASRAAAPRARGRGTAAASTLTSTPPPHTHRPRTSPQCFYEQVDGGNKITGSFEVIAGGMLDADVTVRALCVPC